MVQTAVADIISPAVAAEGPVASLAQVIRVGQDEFLGFLLDVALGFKRRNSICMGNCQNTDIEWSVNWFCIRKG